MLKGVRRYEENHVKLLDRAFWGAFSFQFDKLRFVLNN